MLSDSLCLLGMAVRLTGHEAACLSKQRSVSMAVSRLELSGIVGFQGRCVGELLEIRTRLSAIQASKISYRHHAWQSDSRNRARHEAGSICQLRI